MGGEGYLLFSSSAYVSVTGLDILFTVYAGNGRQRPVVKRDRKRPAAEQMTMRRTTLTWWKEMKAINNVWLAATIMVNGKSMVVQVL